MLFDDLGMTLSLPYNFQPDFIDRVLLPFAEITEEVYLSMHWAVVSTARIRGNTDSHRQYLENVDGLFKVASKHNIRLNFVANTHTDPRGSRVIVDEAVALSERYPGACFTIRSLETAIDIKRELPSVDITPSTLSMVDSVIKAIYWKKAVDPKVLMIAREINRKPDILRRLKAMGFRIKMIPQDNCIPYCPVLSEHLNAISLVDHLSAMSTVPTPEKAASCRPFALGLLGSPDYAWLIAQQNVLPGHLRHLKGLVDIIKLEGRQLPTERIRQQVEYYLQGESLQSYAPFYYLEPPEAWGKIAYCERDCFRCDWCSKNIRLNFSANSNNTRGSKVKRLVTIANISIENGPDLTVSDLDAGLPVFEKAGKFGISYQSDKLTDEIRTGIKKLSEVLLKLQTNKAFRLNFLPTSLELKKAFTDRHVKVTLKQKSLQPPKHR